MKAYPIRSSELNSYHHPVSFKQLALRFTASLLCLWLVALPAAADIEEFEITDIRINGLERIQPGVVFNLVSITGGDLVDTITAKQIIHDLFKSGYFSNISLTRDNDELVVDVTENPSIKTLTIKGNKAVQTDNLKQGLSSGGLTEGEVFQRSTLSEVQSELQRLYIAQGRYNVNVDTKVKVFPLNQIGIEIDIEEGNVSRIAHINLVGNKEFSNKELLGSFELKVPARGNIFSSADRYSREKLQGDLEKLESYYQDRGYVNFRILSTQVSVTPDKKRIYITINIDEGKQSRVSDVQLVGEVGDVSVEALKSLILVKPGTVFSRGLITSTEEYLIEALSNAGYSFASVTGTPEINDETGEVVVKFFVDTGNRTYVRRISFHGNNSTRDEVLRREMRQLEGGWASSNQMDLSKKRLERLVLFSSVSMETTPVEGIDDQIDLDLTVEEQPSGSVSASIGYARNSGALISGSLSDSNVFGTGNSLDFTLTKSQYTESFSMSYFNPYATADGVSRGYNAYLAETDYRELNVSNYRTKSLGGGVRFSIPIKETDRFNIDLGVDYTTIQQNNFREAEHQAFFDREGNTHLNYRVTATWSRSTLNRGIFPTAGRYQSLGAEVAVPLSDLEFAKFTYLAQAYKPLGKSGWVFRARTKLGYAATYGNTKLLPYHEYFYAGGFGSVRGYRYSSLGPRSTIGNGNTAVQGDPFGGNLLVQGGFELIVPLSEQVRSVRIAFFLDAGQVYNTQCPDVSQYCFGFEADKMKYSTGVGLTWLSPLGPLNFSYSFPLNAKDGDRTERFQFEVGGRLY